MPRGRESSPQAAVLRFTTCLPASRESPGGRGGETRGVITRTSLVLGPEAPESPNKPRPGPGAAIPRDPLCLPAAFSNLFRSSPTKYSYSYQTRPSQNPPYEMDGLWGLICDM